MFLEARVPRGRPQCAYVLLHGPVTLLHPLPGRQGEKESKPRARLLAEPINRQRRNKQQGDGERRHPLPGLRYR